MFMLGNFTDGLFGGASHIFELATKYHDLRTKFLDWDTSDKVENAMQRGAQDRRRRSRRLRPGARRYYR